MRHTSIANYIVRPLRPLEPLRSEGLLLLAHLLQKHRDFFSRPHSLRVRKSSLLRHRVLFYLSRLSPEIRLMMISMEATMSRHPASLLPLGGGTESLA